MRVLSQREHRVSGGRAVRIVARLCDVQISETVTYSVTCRLNQPLLNPTKSTVVHFSSVRAVVLFLFYLQLDRVDLALPPDQIRNQ